MFFQYIAIVSLLLSYLSVAQADIILPPNYGATFDDATFPNLGSCQVNPLTGPYIIPKDVLIDGVRASFKILGLKQCQATDRTCQISTVFNGVTYQYKVSYVDSVSRGGWPGARPTDVRNTRRFSYVGPTYWIEYPFKAAPIPHECFKQ